MPARCITCVLTGCSETNKNNTNNSNSDMASKTSDLGILFRYSVHISKGRYQWYRSAQQTLERNKQ